MTDVTPRPKQGKSRRKLPNPDWWTKDDAYKFVDERSRHLCEGDTPACPEGRHWGTEHHHKAGRRGRDPHNPTNLLLLCSPAHAFVHANPELSYERGYLVKRNGVVCDEGAHIRAVRGALTPLPDESSGQVAPVAPAAPIDPQEPRP